MQRPSPYSPNLRARRQRSMAGFTLIEILVIVAILSLLVLVSSITFRTYYPRAQLRHTSSEFGHLIQKARLQAIKRGVHTVVKVDTVSNELVAFADVDGKIPLLVGGVETFPDEYRYTPDTVGDASELQLDDYEIIRHPLSGYVHFDGPGGAPTIVDGFTQIPTDPTAPHVLVFNPDGTIENIGAFRISDGLDNFLEVRVTTIAGSMETRKYLKAADAPGGVAGYFREGNTTENVVSDQVWVWY